jgi:hypothetical protein
MGYCICGKPIVTTAGTCGRWECTHAQKVGVFVLPATGPAWEEINGLFARHGLPPPPVPLRDQLVVHLMAHRERQAVQPSQGEEG